MFERLCGCTMHSINWQPCFVFHLSIFALRLLLWRSIFESIVVSYLLYVSLGGWRYQRIFILTFIRDLMGLRCILMVQLNVLWLQWTKRTFSDMFEYTVKKRGPENVAIYFEDQVWTFGQLDAYSNKVANYLAKCGFKRGDILLLFMNSCPAYIGIWLGATKVGVATGLVNTNLCKGSLMNCIKTLSARGIVVGSSLKETFETVNEYNDLSLEMIWLVDEKRSLPETAYSNSTSSTCSWNIALAQVPHCAPIPLPRIANLREHLIYVYTSGTTGLPKAAIITKLRYTLLVVGAKYSFGIRQSDIIYDPLPLYHSAGGICGVGQMLLYGNTIVIRSKFSASQFWSDCVKYKCTVAQYIGEICRYLLCQPVRPTDKQHHVRIAFGNGLRPQIWKAFQERFNVKQIGEFYGATESNTNIANMDNKFGAVGYVSKIIDGFYPCYIIKIDVDTKEPIRDPITGLCILCEPNEPGHLVARIGSNDPFRMFDGYVNSEASEKKIIRNVLRKGDLWFASGDLMCCDELGYMYFIDRLGDTFRWHGENVSTSEVERVLDQAIGTLTGTVFGVSIPGTEGKAGMAAIALEGSKLTSIEEENLLCRINEEFTGNLPSYARPLFIRLCQNLTMTGTFKISKAEISRLGFDPNIDPNDHVYFLNPKTKVYQLVDQQLFNDINNGVFIL
ncbi:hypothetical protein MS3_00004570 [Schistosoma haematobium]|uniref:Very long-chain fatty acid transport protein n=1 Tax=Schistosoma haematobium TaxID=6185 RepID=A0A922LSU7_SCHHA|nr:hypothetical protein MS3_00004570 [Schistosoma haematobium]KAH9592753.1 hypothetical protein MS3_00004570 [Schistosoma haematobium]CAH8678893.1 unnamed protein product [Schistosoma haematobium]CAH8681468.1 unnamed protein product [Schistosoma haematobium]